MNNFPPVFFGGGILFLNVYNRFSEKKKKYLYHFSAYWLRSSVVKFATLDQILAEFKPSVILRQVSVSLLES